MGGACYNLKSLLVFSMCLLLVFQIGTRVVYVDGQYTDSYDVVGVYILIETFPQLAESTVVVDPCYPAKFTWIECSNEVVSRVTELNLGGRSLTGPLPDFSFSGYYLSSLQIIDVHDNFLSGSVPAFLGNFNYLEKLNLADNRFTGSIPSSLANKKNLIIDFSGNSGSNSSNPSPPGSTTSPPSDNGNNNDQPSTNGKKKSSKLPIILGIIGPVLLIAAVAGVFAIHQQKQRTNAAIIAAATAAQSNGINADKGIPSA